MEVFLSCDDEFRVMRGVAASSSESSSSKIVMK